MLRTKVTMYFCCTWNLREGIQMWAMPCLSTSSYFNSRIWLKETSVSLQQQQKDLKSTKGSVSFITGWKKNKPKPNIPTGRALQFLAPSKTLFLYCFLFTTSAKPSFSNVNLNAGTSKTTTSVFSKNVHNFSNLGIFSSWQVLLDSSGFSVFFKIQLLAFLSYFQVNAYFQVKTPLTSSSSRKMKK